MTWVMKTLDVLPIQVPMRELRAMETEARVLDSVMLFDITESASDVSTGVACNGSFVVRI